MLDLFYQTRAHQLWPGFLNSDGSAKLLSKVLCALTLAGVTVTAPAQTLSEVVAQALQTYPAVLSASAKSAASRTDIERARGAHYPQFGVTASTNSASSGALPAQTQRTSLSPTARLNLWSGGKIEAEADRAEALSRGSESAQSSILEEVAQKATEAYLNWAKTNDLYILANKNVASHRETLNDLRKIVELDRGRRVDFEQALVRMENATLAVQQRKAELDQARQVIRRFWHGPLGDRPADLTADLTETGRLGKFPQSQEEALEMITDDLPAIAQYTAQVVAAQAAVRQAKSQFWPTVDVTVSRQLNSANNNQMDTFTQLQINAPLYNGGTNSASLAGAISQVTAAEFALDEARLLAREKAAIAWQEWTSSSLRASTGAAQSDVGDKLVEAYRQQFRVARRSLLDLLNIQAETFGYRSAALAAFHDERIARVRVLAAIGDLSRRFAAEPGRVTPIAP